MLTDADGNLTPRFFVLPRNEVEAIDTWYVADMCSTAPYGQQDRQRCAKIAKPGSGHRA